MRLGRQEHSISLTFDHFHVFQEATRPVYIDSTALRGFLDKVVFDKDRAEFREGGRLHLDKGEGMFLILKDVVLTDF